MRTAVEGKVAVAHTVVEGTAAVAVDSTLRVAVVGVRPAAEDTDCTGVGHCWLRLLLHMNDTRQSD